VKTNTTGPSSRPLPDPESYAPKNRVDRFLSTNVTPEVQKPKTYYPSEIGSFDSSAERDAENQRRLASQQKTKAGGWASKSLLEREMEMERQRQREWEMNQQQQQQNSFGGRRQILGPRPPPS